MIGIHHIKKTLLSHQYIEIAKYALLGAMTLLFVTELVLSSNWKLQGDAAFLQYIAYLINEQGFVPYRDIFEPNMPMTYLIHMATGAISGYSDFAFQLVNIFWLSAIFLVTWLIMKSMGNMVALAACLFFGFIHLYMHPGYSFGRDFIIVLPIAIAVLLALRYRSNQSKSYVDFCTGICFGFVASIKPHFAIGLPALIIYHALHETNDLKSLSVWLLAKNCARGVVFASLGFACVFIPPFLWLWHVNALEAFWEIYTSYIPLYTQLTYDLFVYAGFEHLRHMLKAFMQFGEYSTNKVVPFFVAILGVYVVLTHTQSVVLRRQVWLLLVFALLYAVAAVLGGRLLASHWVSANYFLSLCATMLLFRTPNKMSDSTTLLLFFAFLLVTLVIIRIPSVLLQQVTHEGYRITKDSMTMDDRTNSISSYLAKNLTPGDKVQPLESMDGVLQAMLVTKTVVATPYVTDFQFYHHVDDPYIQHLRKDFLKKLQEEKPKFMIEVDKKERVLPTEAYDQNPFSELDHFVKENYRKDFSKDGLTIFQRNDDHQP